STRLKPNSRRTRSNAATTAARRSASSPSRLCVPLTGCTGVIPPRLSTFLRNSESACRRRVLLLLLLPPLELLAEEARRRQEQFADGDADPPAQRGQQGRLRGEW